MAQSYLRNPNIERLPTILEWLHTRDLCIPPFQRDFAWTGDQRLALCNSVLLGLPTGSLMVWRSNRRLPTETPIGPFPLKEMPETIKPQYLLDGRQRMTTLYAALATAFWTAKGEQPPTPTPEAAKDPNGDSWAILYDLEKEDFVLASKTKGEAGPFLPLSSLFDDIAYDEWRANTKPSREQTNRARAVRSAFVDYLIPVVPLVTEDINIVTLTFKRVNSGGTKMGDADMAKALVWSEDFDLNKYLDEIKQRLAPLGWGDLDNEVFLKITASIVGLDPLAFDLERLAYKIKEKPELVQWAGAHVVLAVTWLAEKFHICGPSLLPYSQIIIFLSRTFAAVNSLTPKQDKDLVTWLAEVCLDERFGGAPIHMIRAYWRTLASLLELTNAEKIKARENTQPINECWNFSMNGARSRGTALVLARQEPRDGNNQLIGEPSKLLAQNKENIGMLLIPGAKGIPAEINTKLKQDKTLAQALRSPANRVICPVEKLPELRAKFLQADCPEELLRSHLITKEAHQALLDEDLHTFFEARRQEIIKTEQKWLEDKGSTVKIVPEPYSYAQK
jgi:hypothetical protein